MPAELFGYEMETVNAADSNALNEFLRKTAEEELVDHDEVSSAATNTATTATTGDSPPLKDGSSKVDRSRMLISERRRRGRMKEKLFALRSLVPNITKMDKASIVGDAVLYLQDMQMQAKKLKSEIACLDSSSSFKGRTKHRPRTKDSDKDAYPTIKRIYKMNVTEVDEGEYYVKIVSNKGKGIAVLLYKALEAIMATTTFLVHTSNLAASAQTYVLTFTFHLKEHAVDSIDLPGVKLWIEGMYANHGFEFESTPPA